MLNEKGYTLIELMISIVGIGTLIGMGFAGYTAYHFVVKYW